MDQLYIALSIFLLRVAMGMRFIFPAWKAIIKGRFRKPLHSLISWAFLIIGFLLVFGIFVRPASFIAIFLIGARLSKVARDEDAITEQIVSIAALLLLAVLNAGIWLGFDYLFLQIPQILQFYETSSWFSWVL